TAPGVFRAIDFSQAGDVDNWRINNATTWVPNPTLGTADSFIRRGGTGVKGLPCLEMEQLVGDNNNSYWRVTLDPAQTNWPGGTFSPTKVFTTGQTIYIQFRNKWNSTRYNDRNNNSIKIMDLSTIHNTNTDQEVFICTQFDYGIPQVQGATTTQNPGHEWSNVPVGSDFNMQPGSTYPSGAGPGYCSFNGFPAV